MYFFHNYTHVARTLFTHPTITIPITQSIKYYRLTGNEGHPYLRAEVHDERCEVHEGAEAGAGLPGDPVLLTPLGIRTGR